MVWGTCFIHDFRVGNSPDLVDDLTSCQEAPPQDGHYFSFS